MNKYIKQLVEGLFGDDDYDLLNTRDDDNTIYNSIMSQALSAIKKILYDDTFNRSHGWYNDDKYEKKIYEEIEGNAIAFYFNEITGSTQKRHYITHLDIDEKYTLTQINEIFENFDRVSIKYVMMSICIRQKRYVDMKQGQAALYKVDFKNTQFISITANGINPINVTVNQSLFLSKPLYNKVWKKSEYDITTNYVNFTMNHSTWNDTINIEEVGFITLQSTFNLLDYSFIQEITKLFELIMYGPDQVASCNSLQGLPDGNYSVKITYRSNNNDEAYSNMKRQTFVGIPETVSELKVTTEVKPYIILNKISFEGLTPAMQPRFEFEARKFPGKYKPLNIQLGPYKLLFKGRNWSPNKPHLTLILKLQDWFLDCYGDNPHEEYKAPENEGTQKILQAEQKKIDKANQEAQDKKDDLEKMIKNVKKHIKNGASYYGNHWSFSVTGITDTLINFTLLKRWNIKDYRMTFAKFVEFVKANSHFRVGKEEDSDKLYDLIIAPVERSRERILKKRKKDAIEQRKAETAARREAKKAEEAAAKEAAKKENAIRKESPLKAKRDQKNGTIKPEVKQKIKAQIKLDPKIKIYDYSDRAIAVYGETWTVKDKLKELGCKYNKFLTIDGKKTPGWIISNKKRAEVENIINAVNESVFYINESSLFNGDDIVDLGLDNEEYDITDLVVGYVDLGLPSGTKWCRCNVGANKETDYGNYYQWGETKDNVIRLNDDGYEKYNKEDGLTLLLPEDDIAYQLSKGLYRIPTTEQIEELVKCTDNEFVKNYKGSGVNGRIFRSRVNDNYIFIPAAGFRFNDKFKDQSLDTIFVWSSSLFISTPGVVVLKLCLAYCMYFNNPAKLLFRQCCLPVRGVLNES